MLDSHAGLWFVWPRIAPSRVSVTVYKLIWALTDGSHRSMLLGCINCDSQPAAVNFFRRSTFHSLPARHMTGGRYRLLPSRDFSLASAGGHHPPVGVGSVDKSGSALLSFWNSWNSSFPCVVVTPKTRILARRKAFSCSPPRGR